MTELPKDEHAHASTIGGRLKNMGLFLVSPLIGLVYAVLLPGKLFQLARIELKAGAASQSKDVRP